MDEEKQNVQGKRYPSKKNALILTAACIVVVIVVLLAMFGPGWTGENNRHPATPQGTMQVSGEVQQSLLSQDAHGIVTKFNYSSGGNIVETGYFSSYVSNGTLQDQPAYQFASVNDENGVVTSALLKDDASTNHTLTAQIWKDGKLVASNATASAYGNVSLSAPV
jgi:hypothetical protein